MKFEDTPERALELRTELNELLYRQQVTSVTYLTICGQLGKGDLRAAAKGINKLKRRAEREKTHECNENIRRNITV